MSEQPIRVLLVEDDPDDALLIREMLGEARAASFEVEWADRLEKGLEALDRGQVDVALLDLGLPDSFGLETFETAHQKAPQVAMMVLTGLDDETVGLRAVRHGAQDYLVKGHVDSEILARSVRYAIERQRLETALTEALAQLDREFEVVADIQAGLLPSTQPQVPGFEISTHYSPAERAGGDYFDFFPLSEERLGVLLADVSGRGAHAAVLMAMTRVIAHSLEDPDEPDGLMHRVNVELCKNIPRGQFVTGCYGVLDPRDRTFTFACAGHPPPVHLAGERGCAEPLDQEPPLPLGIAPGTRYPACRIALEPGGMLALYTDGVTEALDSRGREFGRRGLANVLEAHAGEGAEAVRDATLAALDEYRGEDEMPDDTTLVVIRALPSGAPTPQ